MDRKTPSKAWTGSANPGSYRSRWLLNLGLTDSLGILLRLGLLVAFGLYWWLTHA